MSSSQKTWKPRNDKNETNNKSGRRRKIIYIVIL